MLIKVTLAVCDVTLRRRLQEVLARPDVLIQLPPVNKNICKRLFLEPPDVLIFSQSLLTGSFKSKLAELQLQSEAPAAVAVSSSVDPAEHANLLADGCDAVLFEGSAIEQVRDVIEAMLEKRRRQSQTGFFSPRPLAEPRLSDFVSESPGMSAFMNLVPRVVGTDCALLIEGETGVGKERLANAIHVEGPRALERFVALNCGALPEHLLESELFGHIRGAFTGATTTRRGWFEVAHRGTLFLDEIGEFPTHLQVKLLRVLQEHEIQPVGGEKTFGVDVRVIAASNRPLAAEVEAGRFRRDLYHRLSVVTVTIPPLRERPEDIPVLVDRHISSIAKTVGRHVEGATAEAMRALRQYAWPGNVRELNNVLERAILLCDDNELGVDDLPAAIAATVAPTPAESPRAIGLNTLQIPEPWLDMPLQEVRTAFLSDLERQYVEGLLYATHGRVGEAAKRAGLHERSFYEKMKQFDLRKECFRSPAHDIA